MLVDVVSASQLKTTSLTCLIPARTLVPAASIPAASIPAAPVSVIRHAGNTPHRLDGVLDVSGPSVTLPRLSAEAPLGDLVPLVAALPSLTAVEAFKSIPVAIAPLSVATALPAGA